MNIGDIFCNERVRQNRALVRNSLHKQNKTSDTHGLIGYSYDTTDRQTGPIYLQDGLDALAAYITSSDSDKLVVDSDDYAVCCTQGMYLDIQCFTDDSTLSQLLRKLNH